MPDSDEFRTSRFSTHLLENSSNSFLRAIRSHIDRDHLDFYLSAGIALEYLLKSRLAAVSPTLIAEPKHFPSMLLLAELKRDQLPAVAIRTIGLTECLQRCQLVVPALAAFTTPLKRLNAYRNGAAHAALADNKELAADLSAFVEVLDLVVRDLSQPRDHFYREFLDFADARLDQSRDEAEISARAAIAAAKVELYKRYPRVVPGWKLEDALHGWDLEDRYDYQRYECPACPSGALLHGTADPEWKAEFNKDGEPSGSSLVVHFYPSRLECRVCGLELHGRQLSAIGVPEELVIKDADESDFLQTEEA
ncbi:hypothetical protein Q3V37_17455 [Micromonospora profundi]|uniref:Uncharacterized protein n=1 Tax=Micromonospora profundi TaxID=1420889 RepID=A0AAJ6HRE4_9ACTN|nr:hypothetical protein [Micromonospora profundi]WLS43208.1 hypothetical protein Q3V37_17455 [Micromonospora profundi]